MTQHIDLDALQAALKDHQGPTFVVSVEQLQGIIARLNKAEAASQWQPIETAPKDGTYILVANDRADLPWVAHYFPVAVSGYRFEQPWRSVMLNCDHIKKDARYLPPTRWMPLPAAPSDSAEIKK